MALSTTFWQDRLDATLALIALYDTAITFLLANPTKRYRLDTGQSVQDVWRQDLPDLQNALESLENKVATLEARISGATIKVNPGF